MKNQHSKLSLLEYVTSVIPEMMPDVARSTLQSLARAVHIFCEWRDDPELTMHDATPEMTDDFVEATGNIKVERLVRQVMRTYSPLKFPFRGNWGVPKALDSGNGSEFLLANIYSRHYEAIALRSRRPNTKRLYKTTFRMFDRFLARPATLDDLNDETVSKFAAWRLSNGVSKHSVNKDLYNLLAFWRWCNRKGMVDTWPDVQFEKPPRRVPEAWTKEEMHTLFRTVQSLGGVIGEYRARDWWAALILVAWDSGERIGAIVGLTWDRVNLSNQWVCFSAEHRKGGAEDSAVRLSTETIQALGVLKAGRGPVFPWPYSYTYIWRKYREILMMAGLADGPRDKFHRIRRTVASFAEAAGGNATAMLRHSKREITEAYLDPKIVKQQQPADVLFRLAK